MSRRRKRKGQTPKAAAFVAVDSGGSLSERDIRDRLDEHRQRAEAIKAAPVPRSAADRDRDLAELRTRAGDAAELRSELAELPSRAEQKHRDSMFRGLSRKHQREERDEMEIKRLASLLVAGPKQKPNPAAASVVAAVAHWLAGAPPQFVVGSSDTTPALRAADLGILLQALILIGETGGEVVWEDAGGPRGGHRVSEEAVRGTLEHLAANGFLTHRFKASRNHVGYGERTISIAREAGVKLPAPSPSESEQGVAGEAATA